MKSVSIIVCSNFVLVLRFSVASLLSIVVSERGDFFSSDSCYRELSQIGLASKRSMYVSVVRSVTT